MEKFRVIVIALLIFGTILSVIGRFMPGLSRGEGIISLSRGKLVNASVEACYYYYKICDEGTSNCRLKTLRERFDEMKTIYSLRSNTWYIERLGELVIDVLALISNVFGLLCLLATCSKTPRLQALPIVAASILLMSATLQLTNLATRFIEIRTYNRTPPDGFHFLFPYSVPLIVIGSVCLLTTSVLLYIKMVLWLFHIEQSQSLNSGFTNVLNVTQSYYDNEIVDHSENTKL